MTLVPSPIVERVSTDHPGVAVLPDNAAVLPSAFDILALPANPGRRAVFLDYDGTLTPIAAAPELATLHDDMRSTLQRLAHAADVHLVSGRDLDDLLRHTSGIEGATYAGSHGYEVQYPDGQRVLHGGGTEYLVDLGAAAEALDLLLGDAVGVRIERKRFAVAVHYRLAPPFLESRVREVVNEVAARLTRLQVLPGKKVLELRPAGGWHKGTLVEAILAPGGSERPAYYLGDDTTDEDAFHAIHARGYGIYVGQATFTQARFRLDDVPAVGQWLTRLARQIEGEATP